MPKKRVRSTVFLPIRKSYVQCKTSLLDTLNCKRDFPPRPTFVRLVQAIVNATENPDKAVWAKEGDRGRLGNLPLISLGDTVFGLFGFRAHPAFIRDPNLRTRVVWLPTFQKPRKYNSKICPIDMYDDFDPSKPDHEQSSSVMQDLIELVSAGNVDLLRQCPVCETWFFAERRTGRYCSAKCRNREYLGQAEVRKLRNERAKLRYVATKRKERDFLESELKRSQTKPAKNGFRRLLQARRFKGL